LRAAKSSVQGLESRRGDELVEVFLLGVGRVELFQVVRGQEDGIRPVAAVLVRQRGEHQRVRLLVGPAHGRRAHLLDRGRRAVGVPHPRGGGRHEVFVQEDVQVPEDDVVGGERRAVRPLRALAKLDRPHPKVFRRFPPRGDLRLDLGAVRREPHEGVVDDADVVVGVGGTEECAPPHAAVLPGPLDDGHDEGVARKAFLNRRELAGFDLLGQHGSFLKLCRLGRGRTHEGEQQGSEYRRAKPAVDAHGSPPVKSG